MMVNSTYLVKSTPTALIYTFNTHNVADMLKIMLRRGILKALLAAQLFVFDVL